MTGSHNMGPKASGVNDENFLIIEGDGELASQYAGYIMQVYSQYRWRASVHAEHGEPAWKGLEDDDKWQIGAPQSDANENERRDHELDFWFGKAPAAGAAHAVPAHRVEAHGAPGHAAPRRQPAAHKPAPHKPAPHRPAPKKPAHRAPAHGRNQRNHTRARAH
jgi:hypothetical protein